MSALFLLFFLGPLVVVIVFGVRAAKKARENFRKLATQLNLEFVEKDPVTRRARVTGLWQGRRVTFQSRAVGSGKRRKVWSELSLTPAAHGGLTFRLAPRSLGTALEQLFGAQDLEVGEPGFDKKWLVQSNQPDFFKAALMPQIQEKLGGFPGEWRMDDGAIVYRERGDFSTDAIGERMARAVELAADLGDIAEVFDRKS